MRTATLHRERHRTNSVSSKKIVTVYRRWREIDGYSRIVPVRALLAADANLNIRRWVDNAPLPEPQDIRAHVHGGVPQSEVIAARRTCGTSDK